jgi:hypothetical protein
MALLRMAWYILMALAAVCFLFAGTEVRAPRLNFVGLGLFCMTVAMFTRG